MGNEPLEVNAKGRKVNRGGIRRVGRWIDAGMWRVGRWIDAGIRRVRYRRRRWAYWQRNGLIGDRMGLSATEWAYRQRFLFWFGFGTVANSYQRRLLEPSRMVERLGLGLGLDHRKWLSATAWILIGDGVGSYWRRFGSYRRWLTATDWVFIDDGRVRLVGVD